ncbi:MAG: hypothetical protein AAFT19_12010 [Pseudomonadota bacterium]
MERCTPLSVVLLERSLATRVAIRGASVIFRGRLCLDRGHEAFCPSHGDEVVSWRRRRIVFTAARSGSFESRKAAISREADGPWIIGGRRRLNQPSGDWRFASGEVSFGTDAEARDVLIDE